MGILDAVEEKRAVGINTKKPYIRLKKPMVNFFVGDFKLDERQKFLDLLDTRIGAENGVEYGQLIFGKKRFSVQERVLSIAVPGITVPKGDSLEERAAFQKAVRESLSFRNLLSDYASEIFDRVSSLSYRHAAQLRVNLLIQPESLEAATVIIWAPILKDVLGVYFGNSVILDAYVFLNQRGHKKGDGEIKKAFTYLSLKEINRMAEKNVIQMPFCISNYTSQHRLELDSMEERMAAAGLMMIVKDGESVSGRIKTDAYNDEMFREECKKEEQALWYSLGYFHLDVAEELRRYITYHSVIQRIRRARENLRVAEKMRQMEVTEEQVSELCNEAMGFSFSSSEIFYAMVKDISVNVADLVNHTRKSVLRNVYGENLDLFYRLNYGDRIEEKTKELLLNGERRIRTALDSFYADGYSMSDMNALMEQILEISAENLRNARQMSEAEKREWDIWLEETAQIANLHEIVKETGEPNAFYELGRQYLIKKARKEHADLRCSILEQYIKMMRASAKTYQKADRLLEDAADDLAQRIHVLEDNDFEVKVGNSRNYYSQVTDEILLENEEFLSFEKEINRMLLNKETREEELFRSLIDFCDERVLKDRRFEKNFDREMLKRLEHFERFYGDEDIYELAFKTIMDNQKFYANPDLMEPMNQEVCFLVNPENQFVLSANQHMQDLKADHQMKIFFEEHFRDMDILFMEGRFNIEKLYHFQTYKRIYQGLNREGGAVSGNHKIV